MSQIKIAIMGAGPVGLTLARLLLDKPNIEVAIFEGEKSRFARAQGGTLDLHAETGLAAVKAMGLTDEFEKHARYDAESFIIADKNLVKYIDVAGSTSENSRGRPEIDRRSLRGILLDSIPEEMIHWGRHLRSIDENRNLIFDDGTEGDFDLVVGADGAWSKIRKYVSGQMPEYSGVGGFNSYIHNAKETAPTVYNLTNRGSMFSFSDGKTLMTQQLGDGSLNVYCFMAKPESWFKDLPFDIQDVEAVRKVAMDEFHDWHPDLRDIIRKMEDPVTRPLYMLPVGWKWDNRPGVTLVGDAAHAMTPFAGEGVNLGMQDALILSQAIVNAACSKSPRSRLNDEIKAYEEDLFARAERTANLTNDNRKWMFFTEGFPRSGIDQFAIRAATFEDKSLMEYARYPILAAGLKAYYFLFKLCH